MPKYKVCMRVFALGAAISALATVMPLGAQPTATTANSAAAKPGEPKVDDPYLAAWLRLTPEMKPAPRIPGRDYGTDPTTGQFIWPKATPEVHEGNPFPGEMTTWDQKSYSKNEAGSKSEAGPNASGHRRSAFCDP